MAYFRGAGEVGSQAERFHGPKIDSVYSRVRYKLANISSAHPDFNWSVTLLKDGIDRNCEQIACTLARQNKTGYSHDLMAREMATSRFCLVPGGDSPDTQRLTLAIALNCIPVIIAKFSDTIGTKATPHARFRDKRDYSDAFSSQTDIFFAPFADQIDWERIAVLVDPKEFIEISDDYTTLPTQLQRLANNVDAYNAKLLAVAESIPHLTYEAPGSDLCEYALRSAKKHCLVRPLGRIASIEERVEHESAGVLWVDRDHPLQV